jgi:integrase
MFDGRPLDVTIETEDALDLSGLAPQPTQDVPSIIALASSHHTYQRVLAGPRPTDAKQLMKGVELFAEKFGEHPSALTSQNYIAFYQSLLASGLSDKTSSDRMKSVKWSSAVWAEMSGRADPLAGRRLIPNAPRKKLKLVLPPLADLTAWALSHPGPAGVAVALGAMGLRPSEIIRAEWGDVESGLLRVGERLAKNKFSVRSLPIPEPLLPLFTGGTGPIVPRASGKPHTRYTLPPFLRDAGFEHQPALLRKCCATELFGTGVRPLLIESWLGHSSAEASAVTASHYLVAPDGRELLPVAKAWATCAGHVAQPATQPDAA